MLVIELIEDPHRQGVVVDTQSGGLGQGPPVLQASRAHEADGLAVAA